MKHINFISSGRSMIAPLNSRWGNRSRQSLATSLLEVGAGLKGGVVLAVRLWLSACILPGRRAIGWFLMILSLSLIVGCSGGSGSDGGSDQHGMDNMSLDGSGGNGSDGGGDQHGMDNMSLDGSGGNGDGSGGGPGDSLEAQWSITPFTGGLRIEWHNLANFSQASNLERISINITKQGSAGIVYSIIITDFVNGIYNLTSLGDGAVLEDGIAYRFTSLVLEYSDNSTDTLEIHWSGEHAANNREDNRANGIVVGENHDGDGRADDVDTDNDNDGRPNGEDECPLGEVGWDSNDKRMDNDEDGCRDDGEQNNGLGEDIDDDNDRLPDNHRIELLTNTDGVRCSLLADCDGDTLFDNRTTEQLMSSEGISCSLLDDCDDDMVLDRDEVMGCALKPDCDDDMVLDRDEVMGCELKPDCDNDTVLDRDEVIGCELEPDCDGDSEPDNIDIDADGDGLIEIGTAVELDAVRHQLDGTGFAATAGVQPNQTGCGDGGDITACNGYELIRDISLTDYIAANYATQGWQPIAHDIDISSDGCTGDKFSNTFDGNGFEVNGLWINRPQQECIGLFGQVDGSVRNLGVKADRIMGKSFIGGLVGDGGSASIVRSYAVSSVVNGSNAWVGGLVGDGGSASIVQSYAISNSVIGGGARVGGLVGLGQGSSIIQSYAVSNEVRGSGWVGGLVGYGDDAEIIAQSYAISGRVRGDNDAGGLVGWGEGSSIIQSYAISGSVDTRFRYVGGLVGFGRDSEIAQSFVVSGPVSGSAEIGGLVGYVSPRMATATATYWDVDTSGRTNDAATGSIGQTSMVLRSPTDYDGIYATWDDGLMVDTINANATIWCDEDNNDMIEEDERRDDSHTNGDNRIWDFGSATDYPALRCTLDNPADQRAWWSLNSTGQPAINQTRLDAWLDGSLP